MKPLNLIFLIYKCLISLVGFGVMAVFHANQITLVAAIGWIPMVMFINMYVSRYTEELLKKSEIIWSIATIIIVLASHIVRKDSSIWSYFIEITLLEMVCINLSLVFFTLFTSIKKHNLSNSPKDMFAAIVMILVFVLLPASVIFYNFYGAWMSLNKHSLNYLLPGFLVGGLLTTIIELYHFFHNRIVVQRKMLDSSALKERPWITILALGLWVTIVPAFAFFIRNWF